MGTHLAPVRRDSTDELHPLCCIGWPDDLVGALGVGAVQPRQLYGLSDSIITLFFAIFVGIPVMLWLSWRHKCRTAGSEP